MLSSLSAPYLLCGVLYSWPSLLTLASTLGLDLPAISLLVPSRTVGVCKRRTVDNFLWFLLFSHRPYVRHDRGRTDRLPKSDYNDENRSITMFHVRLPFAFHSPAFASIRILRERKRMKSEWKANKEHKKTTQIIQEVRRNACLSRFLRFIHVTNSHEGSGKAADCEGMGRITEKPEPDIRLGRLGYPTPSSRIPDYARSDTRLR